VGEEASLAGHGPGGGGTGWGEKSICAEGDSTLPQYPSRSFQDACGRVGLGVWDMKYHSR
jgi:hypothetical protein